MPGSPTYALSPSAQLIIRPHGALQFGISGAWAGILAGLPETTIESMYQLLNMESITEETLYAQLIASGLSSVGVSSLMDDLLQHGILRLITPLQPLCLIGHNALARLTHDVFIASGQPVRIPYRGESDRHFLSRMPNEFPVIVIGHAPLSGLLMMALSHHPTIIPARIIDGRCVIGPLRIRGEGPCFMCNELEMVRRDPDWRIISAQIDPQHSEDASARYVLAGRLAGVITGFTHRVAAPGLVSTSLQPGHVLSFNSFNTESEEYVVHSNPLCPVCFRARSVAKPSPSRDSLIQ